MKKVKCTRIILEECPNCGSIWGPGSEEWDWQKCDCCGWPDNQEDWDNDDFDDSVSDREDDYDQWCEDNDPNDSRNL